MSKAPGVFSLLATAATGFATHLVDLCAAARDRLTGRPKAKSRPAKR
jgi:hypothetical protein